MNQTNTLTLTALPGIPQIQAQDNLAEVIFKVMRDQAMSIQDGDILILAQKIVSKSEDRMVNLTTVSPSEQAVKIGVYVQKRPELIELILRESNEVLRLRPGTIIVEHHTGFVCANAGIDHSNVRGAWGDEADWVLLLPEDSDRSAARIREEFERLSGKQIGVMIIDSHGRAWRNGTVGVCIGLSGMPALVDKRGDKDLYNYTLRVTVIAAADELAAGASLMMGQAAEGTPVVLARGFPYALRESHSSELVRNKQADMFR